MVWPKNKLQKTPTPLLFLLQYSWYILLVSGIQHLYALWIDHDKSSYCHHKKVIAKLTICYAVHYTSVIYFISGSQFSSVAQSCLTLCDPMYCSMPTSLPCPSPTPGVYSKSCPLRWSCHPTISSSVIPFSSCLQSLPASGSFPMSRFSFLCIRWPKYWSFNFSISPSSEYSGLISFRIDGLDHLAVQGTLSLLQHHSSKASILQCSECVPLIPFPLFCPIPPTPLPSGIKQFLLCIYSSVSF